MSSVSNAVLAKSPDVAEPSDKVICHYVNEMQQTQIIRIANLAHSFFERTILPGNQLFFEAYPNAELEVHTYEIASATLTEKITCDRLAVSKSMREI